MSCPQGSVLGPQLWNIQYNAVSVKLQATELESVIYAYDTLAVVSADTTDELEAAVYDAIWVVRDYCLEELGLELNVSKQMSYRINLLELSEFLVFCLHNVFNHMDHHTSHPVIDMPIRQECRLNSQP